MLDFGIAPPGFRLPDGTHVGAVRLQVGDLQRSIDYYESVLGLRVLTRDSSVAALGPRDDDRVLVWLHARAGARPVPRGGVLGLYHFAILVPDRASLGRFVAHLGRIGVQGGAAEHFVSEALYLTDPDGLGIEVYADRPRSTWQQEGRQLYMTTQPLDVRGLVAAGGGHPWAGMPAGTVMGHVHLHVGDLERASAFYHAALGLDKTVWEYPGALFMSAGGYHHHLGTNTWSTGAPAVEDQARLLSWDLVVPQRSDGPAVARSLESSGHVVEEGDDAWSAADPWGTRLRIVAQDKAT
jgi:catechol 2,3-dioxygenase